MLASIFDINPARSWTGTVYISADGSVDPPDAPIQRNGDFYTLTGNITNGGIVIKRNNMTLDGAGYTVQGAEVETGIDLSGRSNVTIKNMKIKACFFGFYLYESLHNNIIGNIITDNVWGIFLTLCSNNNISANSIIANNDYGIELSCSSNNSIVGNKISTPRRCGIGLYPPSNNSLYHNNFLSSHSQIFTYDTLSVWDNGYPSGGNYWTDYDGADLYSGPFQNETGCDGIGDSPYIINENNQDNYPLMKPYSLALHDIGITSVKTSKTIIGQGYNVSIKIMVFNYGSYTEAINITICANETIVDKVSNINIESRNFKTITSSWSTTGFAKGNYDLKTIANTVPGETDTSDNIFLSLQIFRIGVPGDLNNDDKCNILDLVKEAGRFGQTVPPADPNYDFNDDGKINILDLVKVAGHFGTTDP